MDIENFKSQFQADIKNSIPSHSVDCVVIGYAQEKLKILTLKFKNTEFWSLPGRFIEQEEDMNVAALRVLEFRTGLQNIFLEQFYTFGNTSRSDKKQMNAILKKVGISSEITINWFKQRFISTGYMALVDVNKCILQSDIFSESIEWKSIDDLPIFILDHKEIVSKAVRHLRNQMNYLPVGITLLPEIFTLKELQKLYEAILQKPLDRGNFQRKILKLGILIRLEKQLLGKAHKAPYLYKFDEKRYTELLENGIGFVS